VGQSWIKEAYSRSLIPAPAFSLTLGRYLSEGVSDGSLLVIGGYDTDLVDGSITWVHCSGTTHVQIPLDGIVINGMTIKRSDGLPMEAIIDVYPPHLCRLIQSGTGGFIPGPSNVVQAIYKAIGGQPDPNNPGFWVYQCSSAPTIAFQLGGQNFAMDPQDFIILRNEDMCWGALAELDTPDDHFEEPVFLLGALFMKSLVTIFDLGTPRVGFGRLKGISEEYGTYEVVPDDQRTALGNGPSASLSPTFKRPVPTGEMH
jgi:hypothetical protein